MAPNAPTEARHFDFPAARGATEIIGPDNGPREEQGDVPDLGPLHPSHHFNLRGAGPDHDEDEIGGYMQYVSGVSFRHRSVHRSTDRRGPHTPDPARPDSSGHAIRGSPELLGTINGAGAIRRNGPQAILARAGEGVASSQVPVARFQSGPHSGVSRVTVISGSRRTFRPGANIGPPDDPFQSYDIPSPPPSWILRLLWCLSRQPVLIELTGPLKIYSVTDRLSPRSPTVQTHAWMSKKDSAVRGCRVVLAAPAMSEWTSLLFYIICF
ncbi:hypothetical protein PG989_000354 [Apiospora arundinis]